MEQLEASLSSEHIDQIHQPPLGLPRVDAGSEDLVRLGLGPGGRELGCSTAVIKMELVVGIEYEGQQLQQGEPILGQLAADKTDKSLTVLQNAFMNVKSKNNPLNRKFQISESFTSKRTPPHRS